MSTRKTNSTESLPELVNKLYISKNRKRNTANILNQESATLKKITQPVHNFKRTAIPSYDINGMSPRELQASLRRIEENPQQPFAFLANISKMFTDGDQFSVQERKPTEIDVHLSAVAKHIESSKTLLEEAETRVKKIHSRAQQDYDSIVDCEINMQS